MALLRQVRRQYLSDIPYRSVLLAVLVPILGACSGEDGGSDPLLRDCGEVLSLANGAHLRGVEANRETCAWLGVPFAAAPVGSLRFAPPAPMPPWPGVRTMDRIGPFCPQEFVIGDIEVPIPDFEIDSDSLTRDAAETRLPVKPFVGEEDCLNLQIHAPRRIVDEPMPVMVFIHGGAFTVGAGGWFAYEGSSLAQQDVVTVAINYRLGPLGFLSLDELAAETPQDPALAGTTGNAGLLDQIAALRWVRDNIDRFGGDPERVMIYGESAGAMSVCSLLASPLAAGLFQRAVMQSGSCLGVGTAARGHVESASFAAELGCSGADRLFCLRQLSLEDFMTGVDIQILGDDWQPHVDGVVLTDVPLVTLQTGRGNRVPLLAGANSHEVPPALVVLSAGVEEWTWPGLRRHMREVYGEADGRELARLYDEQRFEAPWDAWAAIVSDRGLICPTREAVAAVRRQVPTWHYEFNFDGTAIHKRVGSVHALEIPFLFGVFEYWGPVPFPDLERAVGMSRRMQHYWTSFARNGNPNHPDEPHWPGFLDDETLMLNWPSSEAIPGRRADRCEFWATRTPVGIDAIGSGTLPEP